MTISKKHIIWVGLILLIIISLNIIYINRIRLENKSYKNLSETIHKIQNKLDSLETHIKNYEETISKINTITKKISSLNYNIPENHLQHLSYAIWLYSNEFNLDENLLISIVKHESEFYKYAKSNKGCLGYFQLNPEAHNLDMNQIYDEYYQTEMACRILLYKFRFYKNIQNALNAYNGWVNRKNNYADEVLSLRNILALG